MHRPAALRGGTWLAPVVGAALAGVAVLVGAAASGDVAVVLPAAVLVAVAGWGAGALAGRVHRTVLAEERRRREQLLEELSSAVLVFSGDEITFANHAAQRMFALPRGPEPRTSADVLTDDGEAPLRDAVEEAREVGRAVDVEVERDGVVLAAHATELGAGETALVVRDVTRARRLAAVRRDFVVNASHELKTPVAGIQALAESLALALRHDPARGTRMVTRIEQEAARLASLVRDLLDLARLEERDGHQELRPVDVVQVVRTQVERLHDAADAQQVTVTTDMPPSGVVAATPEDVRSIVANLLENAVRYNRPGGTVTVRVTRHDGRVALEVADTGEGIAPDERERVFERFYRVDKARSRAAGGTGLGLALVRHAVQRLGGTITLDSEVGAGSTFRVELPVTQD